MNIYDLNEIYEMLKRNGYVENEDNISRNIPDIDPSAGADSNCCANINLDIPGGFQDIDPIVFITIGEVIVEFCYRFLSKNLKLSFEAL